MKYDLGIDVGGTKIAYGLFDDRHNIVDRFQEPTNAGGNALEVLEPILETCKKLLSKHKIDSKNFRGIGLAFPSFIDFDRGYILKTTNIVGLNNFDVRKYFGNALQTKIALDNDANVAALAEHHLGAGRGYKDMLYCAVSTGISNGIIINNRLFRGSYGAAGETGHMIITPNAGVECGCGNKGCFMSYTSGSMILKHISQKLKEGRKTLMLEMANNDPDKIDGKILDMAAQKGDPLAREMLDQMAFYLAIWLFNLYQCFNINCFVFGGGLVNIEGLIFEKTRAIFDQFLKNQPDPIYFKKAELGNDFGIIGAHLLLDEYLKDLA